MYICMYVLVYNIYILCHACVSLQASLPGCKATNAFKVHVMSKITLYFTFILLDHLNVFRVECDNKRRCGHCIDGCTQGISKISNNKRASLVTAVYFVIIIKMRDDL